MQAWRGPRWHRGRTHSNTARVHVLFIGISKVFLSSRYRDAAEQVRKFIAGARPNALTALYQALLWTPAVLNIHALTVLVECTVRVVVTKGLPINNTHSLTTMPFDTVILQSSHTRTNTRTNTHTHTHHPLAKASPPQRIASSSC